MSEKNLFISIEDRKSLENNKKLYLIMFATIMVVLIFSIIFYKLMNKSEMFENDNILEQKMFQNMTFEGQNNYLELSDENKKSMLSSLIKK